jgi:hypothetical protein
VLSFTPKNGKWKKSFIFKKKNKGGECTARSTRVWRRDHIALALFFSLSLLYTSNALRIKPWWPLFFLDYYYYYYYSYRRSRTKIMELLLFFLSNSVVDSFEGISWNWEPMYYIH